jgi:type II secretory pathway component PulM
MLAVLAFYGFILKPAIARTKTLYRVIPEKQAELTRLESISREMKTLQHRAASLQESMVTSHKDIELLPHVESLVDKHGLHNHITAMNQQIVQVHPEYTETVIDISLEKVTLAQLIKFLWDIESTAPPTRTEDLHITHHPDNHQVLDAQVTLQCPRSTAHP